MWCFFYAAAREPWRALPASQYSTLDGEKVERIGDDTFVCTLGSFEFFGFRLQPILTAQVDVKPGGAGCVIKVVSAEMHGSGLVENINDMFEIDSVAGLYKLNPVDPII